MIHDSRLWHYQDIEEHHQKGRSAHKLFGLRAVQSVYADIVARPFFNTMHARSADIIRDAKSQNQKITKSKKYTVDFNHACKKCGYYKGREVTKSKNH